MNPYAVLAAVAARWDRVEDQLDEPLRRRLGELLSVVRHENADARNRREAAERAAALLRERLPQEFGAEGGARLAPDTLDGPDTPGGVPVAEGAFTWQGFGAEDLAVLLIDGHRMVGPLLGPVRERLLAEPALDAETVLRGGGNPFAPDLIRLRGAGGLPRLPRFQFSEGTLPWMVVLEVNALLAADRDPWGAADWWLADNAWLGSPPARLLGSGCDHRISHTARLLMEEE
ncbi:hypothetical protein ABZV77_06195 [Streptomyces sp. NPDC004732]|uniref:hypothetical protein n=1 Tax=Streptomyces sp. NPDC004732 TaxID=3154290 RepID=UPI0033A18BA5